jgi:hypothetical protein
VLERFQLICAASLHVMPGLTRASRFLRRDMDCRVKPGNDDGETLRNWKLRELSAAGYSIGPYWWA